MKKIILGMISLFMLVSLTQISVFAEGSRNLTDNGKGDGAGYRAYTERYAAETAGEERLTILYVYAKQGETINLGTSVRGATLSFTNEKMGTNLSTEELAALNNNDIKVITPDYNESENSHGYPYANGVRDDSILLFNVDQNGTDETTGYISNKDQEAKGIYVENQNPNGYHPYSFKAKTEGIYTVYFYSSGLENKNPTATKLLDASTDKFVDNQKDSTVGAWDISVQIPEGSEDNYLGENLVLANGTNEVLGRVFTNTLFLNMGNDINGKADNHISVLDTSVYTLTTDGFVYAINFNGMDPFGFVFYANKRGLILKDTQNNTSRSLYHSVKSVNNSMSDLAQNQIETNVIPFDDELDETYRIFFNQPAKDLKKFLGINDPKALASTITNFKFTGSKDGQTYVGEGGDFTFNAGEDTTATTYQITLDFSTPEDANNKRVLSNTLVKGKNTISWDGKDAYGNDVPAGTYSKLKDFISMDLKGGEVHFPYLDVENNPFGTKVSCINSNLVSGEDFDSSVLYYNNSKYSSGWYSDHTGIIDSKDYSEKGVSTKDTGAMIYNKDAGDFTAVDMWTYYDVKATVDYQDVEIFDNTITLNKYAGEDKTTRLKASFNVYNKDQELQYFVKENQTYTLSTIDNAQATSTIEASDTESVLIKGVKNEAYTLKEVAASEDYLLNENNFVVDFTNNTDPNANKTVDVYNYKNKYQIALSKLDEETNEMLSGATFNIYEKGSDEPIKFVSDDQMTYKRSTDAKAKAEVVSNDSKAIKLEDLENKTYVIKEIKAPDGYDLNANSEEVTLDEGDAKDLLVLKEVTIYDTKTVTPATTEQPTTEQPTTGQPTTEPSKNSKSTEKTKKTKNTQTVKAGDNGQMPLFLGILMISGILGLGCIVMKKK